MSVRLLIIFRPSRRLALLAYIPPMRCRVARAMRLYSYVFLFLSAAPSPSITIAALHPRAAVIGESSRVESGRGAIKSVISALHENVFVARTKLRTIREGRAAETKSSTTTRQCQLVFRNISISDWQSQQLAISLLILVFVIIIRRLSTVDCRVSSIE